MSEEGFHRSMLTHRDRLLELVRHPPSTKEAINLAARFATCKKQNRSVFAYLQESIAAHLEGAPAPSLLS